MLSSTIFFAQNAKPISLFIKDTQGECFKDFYIPIQVKDFANVTNLKFSLGFDPDAFAWQGVKYVKLGNVNSITLAGLGKVSYAWQGNPISLNDNDTLFIIALQPIEKGGYVSDLKFTNDPTPLASIPTNIKTANGAVKIIDITAPIIKCPKTIFIDSVTTSTPVVGITPFIKDTCDNNTSFTEKYVLSGATIGSGQGDANGKVFNVGTTNVIYTASDKAGNKATCPFQVIISDKTPDLFLYAQNTKVSCEADEIEIEIWAKNVKKLGSMDFSFTWDLTAATFKSIDLSKSPTLMEFTQTNFNPTTVPGSVGVIWSANPITSLPGVTLNNGKSTYLFGIKLKSKKVIGNNFQLNFTDNPTPKDASIITATTPNITQLPIAIIPTTSLLMVDDVKKPTVTCPKDIVIMETTGSNTMVVNNLAPVALDNCGIQDIVYTSTKDNGTLLKNGFMDISGTAFPLGNNKVTYTVMDGGGNVATCSFTVKINRLEFIIKSDTLDCNGKKAKIDIIVKNFNNIKRAKFDVNWVDTTNLIWNTSTNLIGATNPSIVDSVDFSPNNGKYQGELKTNNPAGMTLPDNTVLASIILDVNAASLGSIYNVTFSNVVADFSGPPQILDLPKKLTDGNVLVLDKVGPVFTNGCGQDVVLTLKNSCDTLYSWSINPIANVDVKDLCSSVVSVTTNIQPPYLFPTGTTKVNYRAIDQYGNITNCGFNVIVKDLVPPYMPPNVTKTFYVKKDSCDLYINTLPPTSNIATDNCFDIDSVTVSPKNLKYFPIGTTPVTYNAYDKSGNKSTFVYTVIVKDTIAPKIVGLQNNVLQISSTNTCTAAASFTLPVAVDNCSQGLTLTSDIKNGDPVTAGKHIVTFTATDVAGNKTTKTLLLVVIDLAPPVFQNPPVDVTLDPDAGQCGKTINVLVPNAIDNCSGTNVSVQVNQSLSNFPTNNFFEAGKTYNIVFEANDTSASSPAAFYTWKVTIKPDNVPPTIICPGSTILAANSNSCGANVNTLPTPITLSDNCTSKPNIILGTSNFTYGYKQIGSYSVTYTATDEVGNSATCSFTIDIKDITPPTFINMTPKVEVNAEANKCGAKVNWVEPTASDNCMPDSVKLTKTPNLNSGDFVPVGVTKIVYKLVDKAKNVTYDTLTINILDKEAPTATKPCGDLITLVADVDKCGATLNTNGFFIDNCKGNVKVTINNPVPNNFYATGTPSIVNFTVSDDAGNLLSCSYAIKVIDKQKPTHTNCPKDITLNLTAGKCDTIFNAFPKPDFVDKCDATLDIDFKVYPAPASNGAISETSTIYYYAKDDGGNSDTCTYKIIINGNNIPKITCPTDVIAIAKAGDCSKTVTWGTPIITKGCVGIKDTISTFNPGSAFNIGSQVVGYTITDLNGKVAVCTFKVTVKDTVKPKFEAKSCPKDTVISLANDCTTKYTWTTPIVAKDDCSGNITAVNNTTIQPGDVFKLGKTTVSYSATDPSGNIGICKFTVDVKSIAKPTFVKCPSAPVSIYVNGQVLSDPQSVISNFSAIGTCDGIKLSYNTPIANTTCSTVKVTAAPSNPLINSKFNIGETPLTFEAVDTFGNKSTCTFKINVLGIPTPDILEKDTLICGSGTILLKATGNIPGATYKWTGPNNYTNTGQNVSINVPTNPIGVYKVTQVTDEGCVSKSDSISIGIIPAPIGADDKFDVVNGKTLSGNVTTNDKLQKNTPYSINLKTDVKTEAGKLKLNPDGTFTFDAKAGFVGVASFAYEICYTDCKKCSNALIVIIDVKADNTNCEVPTLITPNGDNLNDFLVIDCAVGKADNELTVYNRWGEQVFSAKPYDGVNFPWDATYKTKALPDGTYFYIYKDSANAEAKKGYITIFR